MTTMKYVDEFRDPELIHKISAEIHRLVDPNDNYRFMEVCGGHTFSIFRFGLQNLLPENIELVHGPGCPVCVLPTGRMDEGLTIAQQPDVIFTAFGDVMRVPGRKGTPLELKSKGADIRMIYSPLDALKIAIDNPDRQVVLFAIGFETTAPSTALTILRARDLNVQNFFVYSNHVLIIPAIRAILDSPEMRIDGFIGPGHVSTVIGTRPYEFIAKDYGRPVVISGFEPLDLLQSILILVKQMREGRSEVENQYIRVVPSEGNIPALKAMNEVFEVRPFFEWRGLGIISQSALKLRPEFAQWDAEVRFQVEGACMTDPKAAQCGEVLKGALKPHQCKLFGKECTPEHPVGALMVSSEGACAAYYHHVHLRQAMDE
ncbi:hydrogenase expression/formation protein HypD [Caldalkalibacillus uzonensis]|uniref:Hydrogenase expression/formation protein HypD n=1 Tax=Caldalkalibacillus uzonensis TaxID=353224 RepID=A0ABU0CXB8_9BACI|nr:hydrogenase formation protein HypD [Caldalkalibacillus uzonensis]MDQ0340938.1 hydrogenase expression/formation protein HypD [Caldalkalibacillus uzonensis]